MMTQRGHPAQELTTRTERDGTSGTTREVSVLSLGTQALKESLYERPALYCTQNTLKYVILVDPHKTLCTRSCHHFTDDGSEVRSVSQLSKVTQWVDDMPGSSKKSEYFADLYGFCFTSATSEILLLLTPSMSFMGKEWKGKILESDCLGGHTISPVRPWSSYLISQSLFSYPSNGNNNHIFCYFYGAKVIIFKR